MKRGAAFMSVNSSTWIRLCSTKRPVGSPVASLTISKPLGAAVARVTPASASARLLAIECTGGRFQ